MEINKVLSEEIEGYPNYKEFVFTEAKTAIPLYVNIGVDNYIQIKEDLLLSKIKINAIQVEGNEKGLQLFFETLFSTRFLNYKNEEEKTSVYHLSSLKTYYEILEKVRNYFSHYWRKDLDINVTKEEINLIHNLQKLAKIVANEKLNDTTSEENYEFVSNDKLTIAGAIFITCLSLNKKQAHLFLSQNKGFKNTTNTFSYRRSFFTALSIKERNKKDKLVFTNPKDWYKATLMAELNRIPYPVYYGQNAKQTEKIDKKLVQNTFLENGELQDSGTGIELRKTDNFLQLALMYLDLEVLDDSFLFPFSVEENTEKLKKVTEKYTFGRNKKNEEIKKYKLVDENRVVLKIENNSKIKNIEYIQLNRNNIYELLFLHFVKKSLINLSLENLTKLTYVQKDCSETIKSYKNSQLEFVATIENKLNKFEFRKPNYFTINSDILYYLQKVLIIRNGFSQAIEMLNIKEYNLLRECLIQFKNEAYRNTFWNFIKNKNYEQYMQFNSLKSITDIDTFYQEFLKQVKDYFISFSDENLTTIFYIKPAPNYKETGYKYSIKHNFTYPIGVFFKDAPQTKSLSSKRNELLFSFINEKLAFKEKNKSNGYKLIKFKSDLENKVGSPLSFSKLTLPYHVKAYSRINKKLKSTSLEKEKRKLYQQRKDDIVKYSLQDAFLLCILEKIDSKISSLTKQENYYHFYQNKLGVVETSLKKGGLKLELNYRDTLKLSSVFNTSITEAYFNNDSPNQFSKNLEGLKKIKEQYTITQEFIIKNWMQIEKMLYEKYATELINKRDQDKQQAILEGENWNDDSNKEDFKRLLDIDFEKDKIFVNDNLKIKFFHELRNKALHNDICVEWFNEQLVGEFKK